MTDEQLHANRQGGGRRVVLVHGFTQTGRSFAQLADSLASQFEVVTVDLPFHGQSGDVAAVDVNDAARRVAQAGGIATYVGYSLGGRICLELALCWPQLVDALVLVGATAGIEDRDEARERATSDDTLAARLDPVTVADGLDLTVFLEEWLNGPLFAHLTTDQRGLEARMDNTTRGLADALRVLSTGRQPPSWDRLAELSMPVVAVAGGNDAKFSALARRIAAAIGPNATTRIIADAGHSVPFETPAAFEELLRSVLNDTAAGLR
jgi:2-succinyl-6-hydroxy-2,4-cyclohexadiene-1-carboxylate synthase